MFVQFYVSSSQSRNLRTWMISCAQCQPGELLCASGPSNVSTTSSDKVARSIEALGHIVAAGKGLAALALSLKRQAKCLALAEAALVAGFTICQPQIVGGHLSFAVMATSGKVGEVFIRTKTTG